MPDLTKLSRPISLKKSERILQTLEDVKQLAYARMMKSKVDQRLCELIEAAIESINPPPLSHARVSDVFTDEQINDFVAQACAETGASISLVMEFSAFDPQEVDDAIDCAIADLIGNIDPSGLA